MRNWITFTIAHPKPDSNWSMWLSITVDADRIASVTDDPSNINWAFVTMTDGSTFVVEANTNGRPQACGRLVVVDRIDTATRR